MNSVRSLRWPRLLLAAGGVFLLTIAWRAPASWLLPLLPDGVQCENSSGSWHSGSCARLRAPQIELRNVSWRLRLMRLLRAQLAVEVRVADPGLAAEAVLVAGTAGIKRIEELRATAALDPSVLPALPSGWSGQVEAELSLLELSGLQAINAAGRIRVLKLQNPQRDAYLGSYELVIAEAKSGPPITGELRDLEGPLALQGTLVLKANREYELNAQVAARDSAGNYLRRSLEFLGPANAQGERPLSLAGVY